MTLQRVAVVTGADQGLGFALVQGLCRALGPDSVVYLTARDEQRGLAAQARLREQGLNPEFFPLDVTDVASIRALTETLRTRHGGVDVVVSNAAARMPKGRPPAEYVSAFIHTNNFGTHDVMEAMAPLLRDGGRYLVIASSFGSLRNLPAHLHSLFDTDRCTLADLRAIMTEYIRLVESGQAEAAGWPAWITFHPRWLRSLRHAFWPETCAPTPATRTSS